jgi:hypothetical protein
VLSLLLRFCAIYFASCFLAFRLPEAWREAVGLFTVCPPKRTLWVQGIGHILLGWCFVGNLFA